MAKRQPRRITTDKPETVEAEAPQAEPKPVSAPGLSEFVMLRSGTVEGASGKTYTARAGETVKAPSGEFDHLFNADGSSRYCAKK